MVARQSFAGRCIALPETRELDLFADMLEKRGASTLRCPLVGIFDAPDPEPIEAWLHLFVQDKFDDLILLTGEGLRRLLGFAERAGIREEFVASLAKLRKITRGPKPARELRKLGLPSDLPAARPTTEGIIESLRNDNLEGRKVAVQLYGENPNRPLITFLDSAGAESFPVAPYIYADASDTEKVLNLIRALKNAEVDAIAFTSSPQVERLFSVAKSENLSDSLQTGLKNTCVAAVGPLIADALRTRGIDVDLMPEESFFLKPLVNAMAQHWENQD